MRSAFDPGITRLIRLPMLRAPKSSRGSESTRLGSSSLASPGKLPTESMTTQCARLRPAVPEGWAVSQLHGVRQRPPRVTRGKSIEGAFDLRPPLRVVTRPGLRPVIELKTDLAKMRDGGFDQARRIQWIALAVDDEERLVPHVAGNNGPATSRSWTASTHQNPFNGRKPA